MHQYSARVCPQIRRIHILSLHNEKTFSQMITELLCMARQSPPRWGRARQTAPRKPEFAAKILSKHFPPEMCTLKRTLYQIRVTWLQSSRGKRGAGQVFPCEKRTRQFYQRSAAPIASQISLPTLHAQNVSFVTCVLTEWQHVLSNKPCMRNGGYILLLSYCCHFY